MVRHDDNDGSLATVALEAILEYIENEDYDPDAIDRIAEVQRQGEPEEERSSLYKLKCTACLIKIGKGYHETLVYYDILTKRKVCGGCAAWPFLDEDQYTLIASAQEVDDYSIPDLKSLLDMRIEELERDSTPSRRSNRRVTRKS